MPDSLPTAAELAASQMSSGAHHTGGDWQIVFDSIPDAVFLLDEQNRIRVANRAASRLLGLECEQMAGKHCYEVIHQTAEPPPWCPHSRLCAEGTEAQSDMVEPRLGKSFIVTSTPLRDAAGSLRGSVYVMRDITGRKLAETAMRESSELKYRTLVETTQEGVWSLDAEGRMTYVNRRFAEMLGYTPEEMLGRPAYDFVPLAHQPEARERIARGMRGISEVFEAPLRHKDGRDVWVLLSSTPLRDEAGHITGAFAMATDITERRALEKQNRELQKFEAIGQLAGGIAHDFNNVIGAMLGWAELGLEKTPADSPVRRHFEVIRDQARRGAGLTRQLLAFARRQILEKKLTSLNQCVVDVTTLLEKTIGEHIEIRTQLAADLPSVNADPAQLEQVLLNLCINARDAMPGGGRLVIETSNAEFDADYSRHYPYVQPGRYVQLAVSDTGTGMDAATRDRIFEPFFTTKEMGRGTGLGLATVYGIVKQHGGFIHVDSEPGQGSAFRVYLPAAEGAPERAEHAAAEEVRGGTETILLVEDHDSQRSAACEALQQLGYRVLAAGDGEEALRLFAAHGAQIAAAVLDVVLPKLSGPEICARLFENRPGLPVIFSTGYAADLERLGEFAARGLPILQKPYSPRALARLLREVLDARPA
jgi:two-component system cell cycle sensor histidine kinase/response regulator CckA